MSELTSSDFPCPNCDSEAVDWDEGFQDRWSHGGHGRSEGHYTSGSGIFSCICFDCGCEWNQSFDDDGYRDIEIVSVGNANGEELIDGGS